ncbi:MAG: hypothetical protein M5U28_30335 [Sandaracinaceae bacterium]|nr:hypothetical protein [Sandaracinaceae bacterium]
MTGSLSTGRSPTLFGVDRDGGTDAARRTSMRAAALAAALALLAGPALARAQDEQGDPEESAEDGGRYEPDQRGEHDEEGSGGEGYEPDQRGEHDEEEQSGGGESYEPDQRGEHEPEPEPVVATAGAAPDVEEARGLGGGVGLEVSLWAGGGVLGAEAAGGDNLVRSTQQSSIGGAFGLSASVRVGPVAVGPRLSFSIDPSILLVHTGLGADVFLLDGPLVPYVRASIGLSIATPLGDLLPAQGDASILGVGVELGVGVRWRATDHLFVGVELAGGWHHLWRAAVPDCTSGCTDGELDLRRPGESDALSVRVALTLGWTF